ncbi:MAG TPA: hypothetical protein VL527_16010 [Dongiaceae bacterium]|nr:hypothetical protein [Dongiaceae bacterium]
MEIVKTGFVFEITAKGLTVLKAHPKSLSINRAGEVAGTLLRLLLLNLFQLRTERLDSRRPNRNSATAAVTPDNLALIPADTIAHRRWNETQKLHSRADCFKRVAFTSVSSKSTNACRVFDL